MLSLILMTFSHFNAADLECPEPFFPGPQQNMQNCNWEEQQPANSTDRDFSRSIGPLALLGNYVRYPSLYNGEEALGFASEDCVNKAISSYLAVAEELSHGRSMNRNHEPGDENVALKVYLTTYDSTYYDAVFMQRDCTNELFSLYVSIVEPKSSLHRILSATVGKRGEKMLSPDALYSSMQDEAYALTIYRSYSILADLGRFESSVCEGNSEAIWSFLGKHLDTYAIERLQSGRMRPPRPLDDIKVRISTAECLEYLGGPAQLELVKQLQQNLPAFDEGPIAPKYVPLLRAELDSRVDYLGQLLKTPAMERVAIDNDAFPSPYFPEPKSAATRVLDEFTAARDPAAAT
ncbi:MAG: hypothetical protein KJ052_07770, partial [Candidatus Hydrogenedentes bacterium]|nr:hypothetical protein [Candidatus Hydrogenedentota bacterium]